MKKNIMRYQAKNNVIKYLKSSASSFPKSLNSYAAYLCWNKPCFPLL